MALSNRPRSRYEETLGDTSQPSEFVGLRMTLAEFLALPEVKPYLEWDAGQTTQTNGTGNATVGVVTQKMAPQGDHSIFTKQFLNAFTRFGEDRELGVGFPERRFRTPGWMPVPDVSYIRIERLLLPDPDTFDGFDVLPDIAVEIVSPDQSLDEQLGKCQRYAALGVPVSLVVDPKNRLIFAVRPGQPMQVMRGEDRIDLEDVIPGFDLTVNALFASKMPRWLPRRPKGDDLPPS